MAYTLADVIARNGNSVIAMERSECELSGLELASLDQVRNLFPGVELCDSENLVYFPFKVCHTLPTVNKRGRAFTAPVLARSFPSLRDQMLNVDHQLAANFPGVKDQIAGHIKAARFAMPTEVANVNELAYIPAQPLPVMCLGVAYRRSENGKKVIDSHFNRKSKWASSMECSHNWEEACLLYEGEIIPLTDADSAMLECIEMKQVRPYKTRPLALMLGGTKGIVDFRGAALTESPADPGADVLSFVSAKNQDLATRSVFFMPGRFNEYTNSEVASVGADKEITELASVTVIGETEPHADDGHKHLILSDTTVFPSNGHSHSMRSMAISRGSKPKLSFVTNEHYHSAVAGNDGRLRDHIHSHMGSIPLTGKYSAKGEADASSTEDANATTILELSEMKKTISQLTGELASKSAELVAAKDEATRIAIAKDIATINTEIANVNSDSEIASKIEAGIKAKVDSGELVTKEKAAELAVAAEKKVKDEVTAKEENAKKLTARVEKIKTVGLNPDFVVDKVGDVERTARVVAESLPLDDSGESTFSTLLSSWGNMVAAQKALEEKAATPAPAAKEEKPAEVANVNPKKPAPMLVGGPASEVANTGTPAATPAATELSSSAKFAPVFGRSSLGKKSI